MSKAVPDQIHFEINVKNNHLHCCSFWSLISGFFFLSCFDLVLIWFVVTYLPLTSSTQSYLQCHSESSKLLPPSRRCLYYGDRPGILCTARRQKSPESPVLSSNWFLNWCGNQKHQSDWSVYEKMIALDLPRKARFFLHFVWQTGQRTEISKQRIQHI